MKNRFAVRRIDTTATMWPVVDLMVDGAELVVPESVVFEHPDYWTARRKAAELNEAEAS